MSDHEHEEHLPHTEEREGSGRGHNELIRYLREEAYAVRDCFTRYSITVLTAAALILVAIARFQVDFPYIGMTAFLPVLLLLTVLAMGLHKYTTSNRLLGYELHLQRTSYYGGRDWWHPAMRRIGWEEAMRAWRIVQPSLLNKIYEPTNRYKKRLFPISISRNLYDEITNILRKNKGRKTPIEKPNNDTPLDTWVGFWFDQEIALQEFASKGVTYHAGGYLRTLMILLFFTIYMALCLPTFTVLQIWHEYITTVPLQSEIHSYWDHFYLNITLTIIYLILTILVSMRCINIRSRVKILESGALSIHACAIVWEATILAHQCALQDRGFFEQMPGEPRTMHGYTRSLAEHAAKAIESPSQIHKWINETRRRLYEDLTSRLIQYKER